MDTARGLAPERLHVTEKDDPQPNMNPVEKSKAVITNEPSLPDDQFAAGYLKLGITRGITYQVKVLTWVAWKLLCKSNASVKHWYLGTEVRNARGFHDLVLKYDIDDANGITNPTGVRRVYRFVQIKHKLALNDNVKITLGSLKSKQKKNQYSLVYLFRSYLNMLGNFEKIQINQVIDLTVFTNVDVDSIRFLVPVDNDPILGFEGKGKRYRIDVTMLQENPSVMMQLRQVIPNDGFIYDFLNKLVFAVAQPSEFELEKRIVEEMGKVFTMPQIFYNDLFKNMFEWFLIYNSGNAPYLTQKRLMQYLFDAQNMLLETKKSEMHTSEISSLSEELSKQLSQLRI